MLSVFTMVALAKNFIVSAFSTNSAVVDFGLCSSFLSDERSVGYSFDGRIGVSAKILVLFHNPLVDSNWSLIGF